MSGSTRFAIPVTERIASGERRRHDAFLIGRLGVLVARPATAAVEIFAGGRRRPRVELLRGLAARVAFGLQERRAERALRSRPADLAGARVGLANLQARAADGRVVRARRRVVGDGRAEVRELVAFVAGGELHGDAGRGSHQQDVVERAACAVAVEQVAAVIAPRVRDHVREVFVDYFLDGLVQRVEAVLRADVEDVRAGSGGVDGLDIERLLAEPFAGFAKFGLVELLARMRRELPGGQHLGRLVAPLVFLRVAQQRRRFVRVDDRDGHAFAVDPRSDLRRQARRRPAAAPARSRTPRTAAGSESLRRRAGPSCRSFRRSSVEHGGALRKPGG